MSSILAGSTKWERTAKTNTVFIISNREQNAPLTNGPVEKLSCRGRLFEEVAAPKHAHRAKFGGVERNWMRLSLLN